MKTILFHLAKGEASFCFLKKGRRAQQKYKRGHKQFFYLITIYFTGGVSFAGTTPQCKNEVFSYNHLPPIQSENEQQPQGTIADIQQFSIPSER